MKPFFRRATKEEAKNEGYAPEGMDIHSTDNVSPPPIPAAPASQPLQQNLPPLPPAPQYQPPAPQQQYQQQQPWMPPQPFTQNMPQQPSVLQAQPKQESIDELYQKLVYRVESLPDQATKDLATVNMIRGLLVNITHNPVEFSFSLRQLEKEYFELAGAKQ